jgi:hypothetical protein
VENYATAGTTKVRALGLMLCGWLAFAGAPLLYGKEPPNENEEESSAEMPSISIESDQRAAPPTQEDLKRKFHGALKRRASAPEERRLADGTLEITTQWGHFCAKPLPLQPQSGVGGNIRLAAPCANF